MSQQRFEVIKLSNQNQNWQDLMDRVMQLLSEEEHILLTVTTQPEILLNTIQVINVCKKRLQNQVQELIQVFCQNDQVLYLQPDELEKLSLVQNIQTIQIYLSNQNIDQSQIDSIPQDSYEKKSAQSFDDDNSSEEDQEHQNNQKFQQNQYGKSQNKFKNKNKGHKDKKRFQNEGNQQNFQQQKLQNKNKKKHYKQNNFQKTPYQNHQQNINYQQQQQMSYPNTPNYPPYQYNNYQQHQNFYQPNIQIQNYPNQAQVQLKHSHQNVSHNNTNKQSKKNYKKKKSDNMNETQNNNQQKQNQPKYRPRIQSRVNLDTNPENEQFNLLQLSHYYRYFFTHCFNKMKKSYNVYFLTSISNLYNFDTLPLQDNIYSFSGDRYLGEEIKSQDYKYTKIDHINFVSEQQDIRQEYCMYKSIVQQKSMNKKLRIKFMVSKLNRHIILMYHKLYNFFINSETKHKNCIESKNTKIFML